MARIASAMLRPCDARTSTCLSLAMISSGLCPFFAISVLLRSKAIPQDGPLQRGRISTTGFVSPAGDHLEGPIDRSEILDLRRPHRYPVRVLGEALAGRGIHPSDILIADASTPPAHG